MANKHKPPVRLTLPPRLAVPADYGVEIKSGLAPTDVLRRIRLPNPVRRLEPLRHNSTLLNIRHIRQKNNALPDTHNWRSAPLTGTENDPNGRVWRVRDHAWERGITERCVLLAARHTPHKSHSGSPSERPSVGRGPKVFSNPRMSLKGNGAGGEEGSFRK